MGRKVIASPHYALGIDPGKTGGVAVVRMDLGDVAVVRTEKVDKDISTRAHALCAYCTHYNVRAIVMEDVGALPRMAVNSIFNFGRDVGNWEQAIAQTGAALIRVRPQKWQAKLLESRTTKNKGRDTKELSVERAELLAPHCTFRGPKGGLWDGPADAFHLARWGLLYLRGEVT